MSKKLLSLLLVLTMVVSMLSGFGITSSAAEDDGTCTIRTSKLVEGDYSLLFGETETDEYTFAKTEGGWTIADEDGNYISLEKNKVVTSDKPFVWSTDSYGIYAKVYDYTIRTRLLREIRAETFYLSADEEGALCTAQKRTTVLLKTDAGVKSVSVSLVKGNSGYTFSSGRLKYVNGSYKATIKATALGTTVKTIKYSLDGETYTEGNSFTVDSANSTIYIRTTDGFGKITNWTYENGKTALTEDGYITFSSADEFSLSASLCSVATGKLEYSTDTEIWTILEDSTAVEAAKSGNEYKIYLRGSGLTGLSDGTYYTKLSLSSENEGTRVSCSGNIMTLLDYKNPDDVEMSRIAFYGLFYGCTLLEKAPELPATTLTYGCYAYMFNYCTSLTEAPDLPATTLADYCYYCMFNYCTSLTEAPELPAKELATGCYYGMFYNCTSLTETPELQAKTLADYCYAYMFYGCTSLTEAHELPATTLPQYCYYGMFGYCTDLVTPPSISATAFDGYLCATYMFYGCSSLDISTENTDESGTAFVTIESANGFGSIDGMFAATKNSVGAAAGNTYYYKVSSAE